MRYIDIKRSIPHTVECYTEGRFTLPELVKVLTKDIERETNCIPDINIRIEKQEKLFKYACACISKAIDKMQRMK